MACNTFVAIRFTPSYARQTEWPDHFEKVCDILGLKTQSPAPKDFVEAVCNWQKSHPPLVADGILGPATWRSMYPIIKKYQRGAARVGARPEWVNRIKSQNTVSAPQGFSETINTAINKAANQVAEGIKTVISGPKIPMGPLPPPTVLPNAEDLLIKEMVALLRHDSHTPVEVSIRYVQHVTSIHIADTISTQSVLSPWVSLVGTLKVGQVWPGIKGGVRIILSLTPGFSLDNTLVGEVVFVTESGRFYAQNLEGWVNDYTAAFISGLTRSLTPLKTMLDIEAKFLLGAISATSGYAALFVVTASVVPWCYKNQTAIRISAAAVYVLYEACQVIKTLAPKLYDKVFWVCLKRILSEIPNSALRDEKIMAFFVGQMIWKLGKAALTKDFSAGLDTLKLLAKYIVVALGKAAIPIVSAAAKAVPGAAKHINADQQLVKDLRDIGISIIVEEAYAINQEIKKHTQKIQEQLEKLKKALEQLAGTLTSL